MSVYGFHLVIRKKGMKHPEVYHFFVPKKSFHDKDVLGNWVSSMNGMVKNLQEKPRRKRKNRPDFWCSGEYRPSLLKGLLILKQLPTLDDILSLNPYQRVQ